MHDAPPPQPPGPPPGPADANPGIAPEISRRVASILDAVEREAERLREEARAEAARYTAEAKYYADSLVAERQRRIAELSAELMSKSEAVVARLDDAAPVRQGFENLVRALGDAAERLSHETDYRGDAFSAPPFHDVAPVGPPPPHQPEPQPPRQQGPPPQAYQPPPPPSQPQPYGSLDYPAQPAPLGYAAETYPAPQPAGPEQQPGQGFPQQPHPARTPSPPSWEVSPQQPQAPPEAPGWRELDEAKMTTIQMATSGATRGGVREHLQQTLGIADPTSILDEVFGAGSRDDARVPWAGGQR